MQRNGHTPSLSHSSHWQRRPRLALAFGAGLCIAALLSTIGLLTTANPASAAVPSAVSSCSVRMVGTTPTVTWSAASGANAYIIYRNRGVRIRTIGTSFADDRVASNTVYNYSISPVNNDGRGANRYCGFIRTGSNGSGGSTATAPSSCSLTPILRKEVDVTWSGGSGDYFVVRRNGLWLTRTDGGVRTHDDLRAQHGQRYTYTVEAVRNGVASSRTNCGTFDIPPPGNSWNRPSAPANCTVTRTSGSNQLNWSAVSGTYYIIYRNGGWRGRVDNATSFADSALASGANYTYTIQARSGAGFSDMGTCS